MRSPIRPLSWCALVSAALLATSARADQVVDFEGLGGITGLNQFNNKTFGFSQAGVSFNNTYFTQFGGYWNGWSLSSMVDNVPIQPPASNFQHQYGAYAPINANGGTGATGSNTYAVAFNGTFGGARIDLPTGASLRSLDLANSIYTASAVLHGDSFARPFTTGDFLRLDILGFDGAGATGAQTGSTSFFLADYRTGSFVLSDWTTIDLTGLGNARSIGFRMTTTDLGQFGPNTPLYFTIDNLRLASVPEPASLVMLGLGLLATAAMARRRMAR